LWQYVSDTCVMDVYMDWGRGQRADSEHPVRYVDFRARRTAYYQPSAAQTPVTDSVNQADCVRSLMPSRMAGLFR
jgi:hypothetical protein